MEIKIKVKVNELLAMNTLASTDDERKVIASVLVEATTEHTLLIASDGRRLGILKTKPSVTEPCVILVPRTLLDRLEQVRGEASEVTLSSLPGKVMITGFDWTIETRAIDGNGNYPNWRRVIQKNAAAWDEIKCNPESLQSFGDLARRLGCSSGGMIVKSGGDLSPLEISFPKLPNFYGLLMQMTGVNPPDTSWVEKL